MSSTRNSSLYAVILAGGRGTRFWPLSRQERPKQFLNLWGGHSLLRETIQRLKPLVPASHIVVITNRAYQSHIKEQLSGFGIPSANILFEPAGKNTAPAIAWAAAHITTKSPRALMAVLPSDHWIARPRKFLSYLKKAFALARQKYLVTLGIVPARAETGYGYIKTKTIDRDIHKAVEFTEKPDAKTAEKFFKSGGYLWNSGMFIWRCDVILNEFKKFLPGVDRILQHSRLRDLASHWSRLPSVSIDQGILEKADNVVTIPATDIGWSDVGSWAALFDLLKKDKEGNVLRGDTMTLGCRSTLIQANQRLVVAIGLNDVVVVDTPDALLVCRKDSTQRLREIVDQLKKKGRHEV